MPDLRGNKYRAAINILQRGRSVLVDDLANEILDQGDDLTEGGYLFNEFLELQGTRLHFLTLLISHLEQSAEVLDERMAVAVPAPPKKAPVKRRSRAKKIEQQTSGKGSAEDL